jgi:hypothetical protein
MNKFYKSNFIKNENDKNNILKSVHLISVNNNYIFQSYLE